MIAKRRKPSFAGSPRELSREGVLDLVFVPIYGQPCWNLQPGYGCSLTLEFGKPHLEKRNPRQLTDATIDKHRPYKFGRRVEPRGQWHLWVEGCNWKTTSNGEWSGASDTKLSMGMAAETLAGQKLTRVSYDRERTCTTFVFDLGGALIAEPDEFEREHPGDIWHLFEYGGKVLTLRDDGLYSYQPGTTLPEHERYQLLRF